jgi:hypothetical protein
MGSLFNFSFFITQNMKTQLREGPVYGALPVLYVFLARTGKTIHEVDFVSLDEHGSFQIADEVAATSVNANKPVRSPPRSAAPGVKIVFSDNSGPKQTLYYFGTNLADGSFDRSGFSAFLTKLGPADSLIKSDISLTQLALRQRAQACCSIAAPPSFRMIAESRSPILNQRSGGSRRLGIMLGPSQSSQTSTSRKWRRCFKVKIRLNSGLDTDGARTSRTFSSTKADRSLTATS